jgi:MFS family permease
MFNWAQLIPPVLSISLFIMGVGYLNTLVPVIAHNYGYSEWVIGLLGASYYTGMVLGSIKNAEFTLRVGHIRAFAAFASITTVAALLFVVTSDMIIWLFLRMIIGYAMAGLYIVVESWLLNLGDDKTRGKLLAIYMIAIYGTYAVSQLLVNIQFEHKYFSFLIIAIFTVISVLPLTTIKIAAPTIEQPEFVSLRDLMEATPSGIFGCIVSGVVLGSLYSLFPYYIQVSFGNQFVGLIMFALIAGGTLLQYPIGHASDIFPRRKILILLNLIIIFICTLIMMDLANERFFLFLLIFALGGAAFTVYPVSMSQACDGQASKKIVSITQSLLLVYGVGSIIGPVVGPSFITLMGPDGLLIFISTLSLIYSIFLVYRVYIRKILASKTKMDFVATPGTTVVVAELDPRAPATNTKEQKKK